jgi:hypothetical protein
MTNDQAPMTNQTANCNAEGRSIRNAEIGHCRLIGHWGLGLGHFAVNYWALPFAV